MENSNFLPTICIVGRPNVGKSSLFNCLLRERRAVVVEQSGTTRDRVEAVIEVKDINVKLVDTGGYLASEKDKIILQVKEQIYRAVEEASVIVFVAEAISGISPFDKEMAVLLKKCGKPIILAVNKVDNDKLKNDAYEFFQLGFGDCEVISCLHRRGISGLEERIYDEVKAALSEENMARLQEEPEDNQYIKIAVVGRPNVGKSSFVNCILNYERVIVSDIPGTTRDSIDTCFTYGEQNYILIDTAGIRHKRKIKNPVDIFSIMRAKESIERCDVTILILDAQDGVTRDDFGVLRFIQESGKACLVCVNKWDLAKDAEGVTEEDYRKQLLNDSHELTKFPLVFVSAKTGKKVLSTLEMVRTLDSNLDFKASTPVLNKIFEKNDPSRIPISRRKMHPNFLYIIQTKKRPMEFRFFVNDPKLVIPAHFNYIENQLRKKLSLHGIPIRIFAVKSKKKERK